MLKTLTNQKILRKSRVSRLGGDTTQNWLIMKNGSCVIGLFQGMFEGNILTFNPGWDENAENLHSFTDIRAIQQQLKAQGINSLSEADETSEGPASFTMEDPDGDLFFSINTDDIKERRGT